MIHSSYIYTLYTIHTTLYTIYIIICIHIFTLYIYYTHTIYSLYTIIYILPIQISAPLNRLQEENQKLSLQLDNYNTEKSKLKTIKSNLNKYTTESNTIKYEKEVILQKILLLRKEHDSMKSNLTSSVYDIKQKSSYRNMLLEKKCNLTGANTTTVDKTATNTTTSDAEVAVDNKAKTFS